jgi:hypothetical protein
MTTTIDAAPITPVPAKTQAMDWDCFTESITVASETEEQRLFQAYPTPQITAKPGTDEWNQQYQAQRRADRIRTDEHQAFQARLIVAIAEALETEVPGFSSLIIEYQGSGDSGEEGDLIIDVDFIGEPSIPSERFEGRFVYSNEQSEERVRNQEFAESLLPADLTEWLDETAWAIAYSSHPGFEIDAGGFGNLCASRDEDTNQMTLTIQHTQRTEETYPEEVLV